MQATELLTVYESNADTESVEVEVAGRRPVRIFFTDDDDLAIDLFHAGFSAPTIKAVLADVELARRQAYQPDDMEDFFELTERPLWHRRAGCPPDVVATFVWDWSQAFKVATAFVALVFVCRLFVKSVM